MSTITVLRVDLGFTLWYHDGTGFTTRTVDDLAPCAYRHTFTGMVNAPVVDGMVQFSATLERIFAGTNYGSGMEFPGFVAAAIRSLSVGDVVQLGESAWMVEPFGWGQLSADQFRALVEAALR